MGDIGPDSASAWASDRPWRSSITTNGSPSSVTRGRKDPHRGAVGDTRAVACASRISREAASGDGAVATDELQRDIEAQGEIPRLPHGAHAALSEELL